MGTWKFIVSQWEVWVAPETGGWHLKWRQSYRRDLRAAGMTVAPRHPADLRELVSGSKWGHKYQFNWMKSLNRKVVWGAQKKGFSVSESPPRDARIYSFWWVFLALVMARIYARWKSPATAAIQSLCFVLFLIRWALSTSSPLCSYASLHRHYKQPHHHRRAWRNSADGCKVGGGHFFLQRAR